MNDGSTQEVALDTIGDEFMSVLMNDSLKSLESAAQAFDMGAGDDLIGNVLEGKTMDNMIGLKRTHYCGTVRMADCGQQVTVCGWVQRQRDLGKLILSTCATVRVLCSWPLMSTPMLKFSKRRLPPVANSSSWRRVKCASARVKSRSSHR